MNIDVFVVPYDSAKRGERMGAGPQAFIDAGLLSRLEAHGHEVRRSVIDPPVGAWRAEIRTAFNLAATLATEVRASLDAGRFPLILSGNCGASLGACAALGPETVVRADAHGDFNTPDTTVGGFLDGMALATLTGQSWREIARRIPGFIPIPEDRVWLLGARHFDLLELESLESSAIHRVPSQSIHANGVDAIVSALPGTSPLHLHLDLDVLDSGSGRANGFAVPGGPSTSALVEFCHALRVRRPPSAITLSSYDPEADDDGRAREAAFLALDALLGAVGGQT